MMSVIEFRDRVDELADSWVNGNRKWVAKEIFETPGAESVELLLAMGERLDIEQIGILQRLIGLLQESASELCETCGVRDCDDPHDPDDISWITDEMFADKLGEICASEDLLSIPGVYEIVSDHFNNEVIEALQDEHG